MSRPAEGDRRHHVLAGSHGFADEIERHVQLTAPQAGVIVRVQLVDVDDPSANKEIVNSVTADPNGQVDEILHCFGGEHGTMGSMGDDADATFLNKRDLYNQGTLSMFRMNLPELKLVRDSAKGVS